MNKAMALVVLAAALANSAAAGETASSVKAERDALRGRIYAALGEIKDAAKRASISNVIFSAIADYEREAKENPRLPELMVAGLKADEQVQELMREVDERMKKGGDSAGLEEKIWNLRMEQRRAAREIEEIVRDTPGLAGWRKSSEALQAEWRNRVISDELMNLLMREGILCNKHLFLLHCEGRR